MDFNFDTEDANKLKVDSILNSYKDQDLSDVDDAHIDNLLDFKPEDLDQQQDAVEEKQPRRDIRKSTDMLPSATPNFDSSATVDYHPSAKLTLEISEVDDDEQVDQILKNSEMESPKMSGDTLNDHLLSINVDDSENESETENMSNLNQYSDINLDKIKDRLKREEIRMKQNSEKCNYGMNQPLTQKRIDNAAHGKDTSFFKLSTLNLITNHINNYTSEYGPPTIVKTHYKFIAIGTQNGFIFIFDHTEKFQFVLSPSDQLISQTNRKIDRGVTALDFSHNGAQLAVGHRGGQLILWDVTSKKVIKFVKDAHTNPIVFVYFYKKGQLRLVSSDSRGVMQTWSFSKLFFSYQVDRSTLFNGKRAGILYDVALYQPNPNYSHVLDVFSLCAVANAECVFFVTLDPARTLKQTILLSKFENCLPIIAWRLAYTPPPRERVQVSHIHAANSGVNSESAAAKQARGREKERGRLAGPSQRTTSPRPASPAPPSRLPPPAPTKVTPSPSPPGTPRSVTAAQAAAMHQIGFTPKGGANDTAMTKNTTKGYQVYQKNPILAVASSMKIQLVEIYARNEKQLQQTRETQLIQVRGLGQVELDDVIVGMKWLNEQKLVVITEKRHIEIIEGFPLALSEVISRTPRALVTHRYFVDPVRKQVIECFENALEIVQGLDRSGNQNKLLIVQSNAITQAECMTWNDQIQKLTSEGEWIKAFCLIIEFMEQYSQGKISPHSRSTKELLIRIEPFIIEFADYALKSIQSDSDLEMFCGVAMDYCVSVGRNSLLFTKVFDRLKDAGGREIFFRLLEPYILNDRIQSLPAEFLHHFVEYLRSKNSINSLEQIILHLSPSSFDFHQIINICRDYQLFTALCYVHNNAFKDFGEPICDMYDLIIVPNKKQLSLNTGNAKLIEEINQKGYHLLLYLTYVLNGTTFPWCQSLKIPTKAKQSILNVLFNRTQANNTSKYDILRFLIDLDLEQILKCLAVCFDDKHLFSKSSIPNSAARNQADRVTTQGASPNVGSPYPSSSVSSPGQRMRRTSVQIKDMLFNAQSAVVSSAKWAWSTSVGYVGTGGDGGSRATPQQRGSKLDTNSGIGMINNNGFGLMGSDDPALDYSLNPSIKIPDRQQMMDVLVNIIFNEKKNDAIVASSYDLKKMNEKSEKLFYQFCTPYLAAGVCNISIQLLHNVLKFLFNEAIRTNNEIFEDEQEKREFETKNSFVAKLLSPRLASPKPPTIPEEPERTESEDEDFPSFANDIKRRERQIKELKQKKLHLENTVLVILSRKLDEEKNSFNLNDLVRQAQSCKFHKIELYLHKLSGNHDAVIDSYFNDDDMRGGVFRYIHNLFYDTQNESMNSNTDDGSYPRKKLSMSMGMRGDVQMLPGTNVPIAPKDTKQCSQQLFNLIKLTLKRLNKLVDIDPSRACQLVFTWFPHQFEDALKALEDSSDKQYKFLKQVILSLEKNKQDALAASGLASKKSKNPTLTSKKSKDGYTTEGLLNKHKHIFGDRVSPSPDTTLGDRSSLTFQTNSEASFSSDAPKTTNNRAIFEQKTLEMLLGHWDFELKDKHHEIYIKLLCEHSKNDVLSYLETNADRYDINKAQRYCEKYKVLDASAYLKERSGDPVGALELIMKALKGNITQLWDEYQRNSHVIPDRSKRQSHLRLASSMDLQNLTVSVNCAKIVSDQLTMAINLCQSYTKKQESDPKTQHLLWNSLLDNCLSMQQDINDQLKLPRIIHKYQNKVRNTMKETGNELVSKVLQEMMSERIDLYNIFMKVVDKGTSEQFGYYRDTINVMLSTYRYETNMMRCAKNLFKHGCHNTYMEMKRTAGRAYHTKDKTQHSFICRICEKYLKDLPPSLDESDNKKGNRNKSNFGVKPGSNNTTMKQQSIKIFACGHGFHEQCLSWMTGVGFGRSGSGNHNFGGDDSQCPICSELTETQRIKMEDATRLANQQRRKEALLNDGGDNENKSFVNQNRGNFKQKTDILDKMEAKRELRRLKFEERRRKKMMNFDYSVKLDLAPKRPIVSKGINVKDIKTVPGFANQFNAREAEVIVIDA